MTDVLEFRSVFLDVVSEDAVSEDSISKDDEQARFHFFRSLLIAMLDLPRAHHHLIKLGCWHEFDRCHSKFLEIRNLFHNSGKGSSVLHTR